jgi:hypothetical protein
MPPSPLEWLADDHQVYFLLDLVDGLDLSAILGPAEAKDPRGHKGFDPRILTMRYLSALLSARDALIEHLNAVYCALLFMGHA